MISPGLRVSVLLLSLSAASIPSSVSAQTAGADLEIVSIAIPRPEVFTEETFQFTVRIRNNGPEVAKNVSLGAGANALTLFHSITGPAGWNCDAPRLRFGYAMNCSAPALAPLTEAEFAVVVSAPQQTAMAYRIMATVTSGATPDPQDRNSTAEHAIVVRTSDTHAELALTATDDGSGRARLEVRNDGPDAATMLTLIVTGPTLRVTGPGWQCGARSTSVACSRGALAAGEVSVLTVRPIAPESATVSIDSRVRAERVFDQNSRNNGATAAVVTTPATPSKRRSTRS